MALGSLFSNLFGSAKSKAPEAPPPSAALDKRIAQRRESVEQAVTEAMMDAGVVSSVYRREVRAIDERGHHFQIVIDLPKSLGATPAGLLAQVGATIERKAKAMNGGEVIGVYWQVAHDPQVRSPEPINLLAPVRNPQAAPAEPPAPSAAELSAQRVARLREMMKDDPPRAGAQTGDEPDQGFANTVMGFDADDTPPKKR